MDKVYSADCFNKIQLIYETLKTTQKKLNLKKKINLCSNLLYIISKFLTLSVEAFLDFTFHTSVSLKIFFHTLLSIKKYFSLLFFILNS